MAAIIKLSRMARITEIDAQRIMRAFIGEVVLSVCATYAAREGLRGFFFLGTR